MARKYRKKPIPYCGGKEIADEAACVVKRLFHFMKSNYPSLIESINYLEPFAVQENLHGFATDGKHLFYHPQWVCKRRYSVEMLEKRILHIIIHGLLGHFERYMRHEKKTLFSKVMDLQALVLMSELNQKPSLADHHLKFIRQEFTDEIIDCLIYFSDGCGGFPEKEPDYPVFFVFPSKEYYSMGEEFCPKWVRRVLLENDFQAQMALGMR